MRIGLTTGCIMLCLGIGEPPAFAHGGVVLEEDLCVINIGYFQAHFKIFLPRQRQRQEFCEDIPSTGESVFVMEYLHSGLDGASIDFRVISNVTGLGRYAGPEDVARIDDIEGATVFYQPPAVVPGVYSIVHRFDEPGDYIGVVTAIPGDTRAPFTAVFPFRVGFTGFGYWPLIVFAIALVQLHVWYSSGRLSHWLARRGRRSLAVAAGLICAALVAPVTHGNEAFETAAGPRWWNSRAGHFSVSVDADLEPLVINRIHRWVVRVKTRDGAPVLSAQITIRGGMPAHDHGLPTRPESTRNLGEGRYLIEGMRFHMAGHWEVILSIDTGARRDDVVIDLQL